MQELAAVGACSRAKGKRSEREIVALARAAGLPVERTWHTAQSPDARECCCDVLIAGQPFQVRRAAMDSVSYTRAWNTVAGLFVRANGREWLAVLPAEKYMRLLRKQGACIQI